MLCVPCHQRDSVCVQNVFVQAVVYVCVHKRVSVCGRQHVYVCVSTIGVGASDD